MAAPFELNSIATRSFDNVLVSSFVCEILLLSIELLSAIADLRFWLAEFESIVVFRFGQRFEGVLLMLFDLGSFHFWLEKKLIPDHDDCKN